MQQKEIKIFMIKRKLYKFKEFNEYTLDSLKNDKIWYSDPRYFNDIFDTCTRINQVRKELNYKKLVELRKNGTISESHFDNLKLSLDGNIGILSLTTEYKSNVMWAHYGNYHKGFCMEFEFEYNDKQDYFKSCHWSACDHCDKDKCTLPSMYRCNYSYAEMHAYKVKYNKLYEKVEHIVTNLPNQTDIFLNKSDEWKYENEYRIIISRKNKQSIVGVLETILQIKMPKKYSHSRKKIEKILNLINNDYFDNCIDIIKPIIKDIDDLGSFSDVVKSLINILNKEIESTGQLLDYPSKLTSIIFGYRMSLENKQLIKDALKDWINIKYKRIVPSEFSYELKIEDETFE